MQFFTRIFFVWNQYPFLKIPIQHGTSTAAVCTILMFRFSLSVQISSKILFNSVSSVFPSLKIRHNSVILYQIPRQKNCHDHSPCHHKYMIDIDFVPCHTGYFTPEYLIQEIIQAASGYHFRPWQFHRDGKPDQTKQI